MPSSIVLHGLIHPPSAFHAAVKASTAVLIAVIGSPAIAAVVPPAILPISIRSPGVHQAYWFSVVRAVLSGSGVVQVSVAVSAGSRASVAVLCVAITSSSVVASTVPHGSSLVSSNVEPYVCLFIDPHLR